MTWPRWKGIAARNIGSGSVKGSGYSEGYGKTAGKGAEKREFDDSHKIGNRNRKQKQGAGTGSGKQLNPAPTQRTRTVFVVPPRIELGSKV